MKYLIFSFLISFNCLFAKEPSKEELSKAMGHLIKENLDALDIELDFSKVLEGIEEAQKGVPSPMDEQKCLEMLSKLQEQKIDDSASINLQAAENFLASNRYKPQIHVFFDGEIQYEIINEGSGDTLKGYHLPIMNFQARYSDGTTIGEKAYQETVDLDATIPGFRKAVLGMKIGEKRIIYLHPKWAHNDESLYRPQSLIIFDVELVDLNQKQPEIADHPERTHLF
jgi:peptidylprolyl isomerase